jgi:hypothetical protein
MILNTSFIPILVVLIIAIIQKKYVRKFLTTETTTPQTAKTLESLGLSSSYIFQRLLWRKVIIECGENLYYLDEDNLQSYKKSKIRVILILTLIILIALLICNLYLSN